MLSRKCSLQPFKASSCSLMPAAAVPRLPLLQQHQRQHQRLGVASGGSSSVVDGGGLHWQHAASQTHSPQQQQRSQQQQQQQKQQQATQRRHLSVVCAAAAGASGAGGAFDPYKVLGVERDADTNAVNRAYSQKKYAARGNDALTQQIEAAHSAIMMSALTARMRGKGVARDIAYADTEPLFPWRPKRWDATPKVMAVIGAIQMALIAYGYQAPNMSKVVGSMLIGVAGNVLKQNAIAPPPKDASMATEEEAGRAGRNFIRGALLGVGATMAGVLLFGAPEYLAGVVKLPPQLTEPGLLVSLKIAGACICNWIMTSFYY